MPCHTRCPCLSVSAGPMGCSLDHPVCIILIFNFYVTFKYLKRGRKRRAYIMLGLESVINQVRGDVVLK